MLVLVLQVFVPAGEQLHLRGLIQDLVLHLSQLQGIVSLPDDLMEQLHVQLGDSRVHVAALLPQQFDLVHDAAVHLHQLLQGLDLPLLLQ